jgi:hypothetical protein
MLKSAYDTNTRQCRQRTGRTDVSQVEQHPPVCVKVVYVPALRRRRVTHV